MIGKFFLNTKDRRTGIEDARKYAEQLIEFAPDADTKENIARALTYVPPGILELQVRAGVKISVLTLERQLRDVSPMYPHLGPTSRAALELSSGVYMSPEKRVYVQREALQNNPVSLVHELGHATDAAILWDRAQRDPDRYPDVRTLADVGGDVSKLPDNTVHYLSYMGKELPGIEPDGDRLEDAWSKHEIVSTYAAHAREEMFAEAFRHYCDTGTPADAVNALGKGTRKSLEQKAPTLAAFIDGVVQQYNQERTIALEAQRPVQPEITSEQPDKAQERGKRDFRQEITEKIVSQLEAGKIPWEKPWEFTLPFNGARGNQYHGINQLILMLTAQEEKWGDPRWMTFKQALDKGWSVRKGEQSTTVEYWKPPEKLKDEELQKRFAEAKKKNPELDFASFAKEEQRKAQRWQVFYARVFNAAQIDVPQRDDNGDIVKEIVEIGGEQVERPVVQPLDKAMPWAKRTHEIAPVERVEQLIAAAGSRVEYGGAQAYYSPSRDVIVMPPRDTFKSVEGFYGTLLHEHGHWTGHKSRLDRSELQQHPFGSPGYAKEELRAELASVFLSAETGIQYDVTNHAAYIQSWVQALREDKNEIFKAAKDAEKITDYVLAFEKERAIEIAPDREQERGTKRDAQLIASPLAVQFNTAPAVFGHTHDEVLEVAAYYANRTGATAYIYERDGQYGVTAVEPSIGEGYTREYILPANTPRAEIGNDLRFSPLLAEALTTGAQINMASVIAELERAGREGSAEDRTQAIDALNQQAALAWERNNMAGLDYAVSAIERLGMGDGRALGASPFMPQALLEGKPVDLSVLPVVSAFQQMRTAEQVPYDFNARVTGRDAEGEHVIAKLGGKPVAIGREAFSELPNIGEVVEVKRDGEQTKALTERQAEVAAAQDRDLEPEIEVA